VAIQPRFDAHGPQRFLGGEPEHPERIRVQLAQPRQGHQCGLRVIILVGQLDQILGKDCTCSPPRSGAAIVFTSLSSYDVVSTTLAEGVSFRFSSTLSTYLPVLVTTTHWYGSPDLGRLDLRAGSRLEAMSAIPYHPPLAGQFEDPG